MPLLPAQSAESMDAMNLDETAPQPTYTHYWDIYNAKIAGKTDGLEAMRQAIHHVLFTERYEFVIYSWNYGVQLQDLFGKPVNYCVPMIKSRVTEALTWDDRILDVIDWRFEIDGGTVKSWFTVATVFGDIDESFEVPI